MNEATADRTDPTETAPELRRAFEEVRARLGAISDGFRRPDVDEMRRTASELTAVVNRIEWLVDVSKRR
jgi:hypothetical protein